MFFQALRIALMQWLEPVIKYLKPLLDRLPRLPSISDRLTAILVLCGLMALAFLVRCLHLFDANHYFILSPDSYFFHWVAQGIMAGEAPPISPGAASAYTLHSGLAYPLAYIAKAASYIFHLSSADALNLVAKFLPPVLSVISMAVMYLAASRIYNKTVGLFSALAWGFMLHAFMVGTAGYIDRDVLSQLLLVIGAFLFYFSGSWHLKVGNRDVGWLVAGLGVLGIEVMLYLEWLFVGPVLLLAVVVFYFVVRLLLEYIGRMKTQSGAMRRLTVAVSRLNWRGFALVILCNMAVVVLIAAIEPGVIESLLNTGIDLIREQFKGEVAVAELAGLSPLDLIAYEFFWVPMVIGLYLAWVRREEGTIFFACWFLGLLILSLFAKRILLYAAPGACLLSGVGLAFLWGWMRQGGSQALKKAGVAALLFLTVLLPAYGAYSMGGIAAPSREWQEALAYLRDETPQDARVMSQWSWGYWILDLGQRRPVVDNGYYGYDEERLRDVGLAYAATEPAQAAELMRKWDAEYLVFSESDLDFSPQILNWAELSDEHDDFPVDSLVVRSLNGQFESGGGLKVVYRSEPDGEVVILKLSEASYP